MALPKREGISGEDKLPVSAEELHQLRFSQATSLRDLINDYMLFSHSLLFLCGGLQRDPLQDYAEQCAPDQRPFQILFNKPYFTVNKHWLAPDADLDWTRTLMAVPHEAWPPLRSFLVRLAGIDRKRGVFFRVALQNIEMLDSLWLERSAELPSSFPSVPVWVVGVDSNRGVYGLDAPVAPSPFNLPRLARLVARPSTLSMAQGILSEHPAPMSLIEPTFETALQEVIDSVSNVRKEKTGG